MFSLGPANLWAEDPRLCLPLPALISGFLAQCHLQDKIIPSGNKILMAIEHLHSESEVIYNSVYTCTWRMFHRHVWLQKPQPAGAGHFELTFEGPNLDPSRNKTRSHWVTCQVPARHLTGFHKPAETDNSKLTIGWVELGFTSLSISQCNRG